MSAISAIRSSPSGQLVDIFDPDFIPLTTLCYVDKSTAVPLPDQNGSIELPFSSLTGAAAALFVTGGTILLVPGNYSAEPAIALGPRDFTLSSIDPHSGYALDAANAAPVSLPALSGTGNLNVVSCRATGNLSGFAAITTDSSFIDGALITSRFEAFDCRFTSTASLAAAGVVNITDSRLEDFVMTNSLVGPVRLVDSILDTSFALTFTGAAGVLRVDDRTNFFYVAVVGTTTNGTVTVESIASLGPVAANTVIANPTAAAAIPIPVAVGTNTLLGRAGANIVAAQAVNSQITGGAIGTSKGVSRGGAAGTLEDLTGLQQSQNWRRSSEQLVSPASGTIDVILAADTTVLRIESTADVTLRTMQTTATPDQGREIMIDHVRLSGTGNLTLPHNTAGLYSPFFLPNALNIILGQVASALVRARSGFWVLDASGTVNNNGLAPMAANTAKVNATASSAVPTDLAIAAGSALGRAQAGNIVALTGAQQGENIRMGSTVTDAVGGTFSPYTLGATTNTIVFTANATINGITDGSEGRELLIINGSASGSGVSVQFIQFSSATSGGNAEKILLATVQATDAVGLILAPGGSLLLRYTSSRWRQASPACLANAQNANTALVNATAAIGSPLALAIAAGGALGRAQAGNIISLTGTNQGENLRWAVVIDTTSTGTIVSYSPTGYTSGTSNYVRISPAGAVILRGMAIAAGCEVTIRLGRTAAFTVTLNNEDALANAGEAFNNPDNADLVLRAGEGVIIRNSESRNNVVSMGKIQALRKNTTGTVFTRAQWNMIEGAGITIAIADVPATNEVSIQIDQTINVQEDGPTAVGVYEPTLNANTKIYRVNPAGDFYVSFTGFAFTGGNTGKSFMLVKQGLDGWAEIQFNIGTVAANGCFTPDETPTVLAAGNAACILWYQTSAARWNVAAISGQCTPWNLAKQRTPFGAPANQFIASAYVILQPIPAGAGGAPDDVTVYSAAAPFSFAIAELILYVSTAVLGSTAQLRTAAGGGGTSLSSLLSTAATGAIHNNSTGITSVALNGSAFLRRSDSAVVGQLLIIAYRF